ncbi:MAG: hypothetical protein IJ583_14315 [Firmicutes bacterium]|nr:hypothetical protein [Bacillota bacterium]
MDLNMYVVNTYMSLSNMDVAQQLAISTMKRNIEGFEAQAQELIEAVDTSAPNIVTADHVDVSI